MANPDFRALPSVNELLSRPLLLRVQEDCGPMPVKEAVRRVLERARRSLSAGDSFDFSHLEDLVTLESEALACRSFRPVLNATGILLHTNLGRAPLGSALMAELAQVLAGYSNLEFDLESGERGSRYAHIRHGLQLVTGAEDSLVVNNNAAAMILALDGLCRGGEVIISRGEMIEIGGGFRLPEIMEAAGCKLVEVGSTNKTRLDDYRRAITPATRAILKCHRSNFVIHGFSAECSLEELAGLSKEHKLHFLYDLGSGLLRKPAQLPLIREPDVQSSLAAGADLVMFSCDKLLGGPQGGVIAGRRDLIAKLSKVPLLRALRISKLDLVALAWVVRQYMDDEKLLKNVPIFARLRPNAAEQKIRAEGLLKMIADAGIPVELCTSEGQVGGGTLPDLKLPSYSVRIVCDGSGKERKQQAEELHRALRLGRPAVLGVLREGSLHLDVMSLSDEEMPELAAALICARRKL